MQHVKLRTIYDKQTAYVVEKETVSVHIDITGRLREALADDPRLRNYCR